LWFSWGGWFGEKNGEALWIGDILQEETERVTGFCERKMTVVCG
jgi:hypothetical protein